MLRASPGHHLNRRSGYLAVIKVVTLGSNDLIILVSLPGDEDHISRPCLTNCRLDRKATVRNHFVPEAGRFTCS